MGETVQLERTVGHWQPTLEGVRRARRMVGAPLRRARAGRMTQVEAANAAGVAFADYVAAERGDARLPHESLARLAAAWDLQVGDLVLNECMPSAPVGPVARLRWVQVRSAAFAVGRIKRWPGGTEGGKKARES